MTDSTDPLVAAAVRPLTGDAEMRSSAVHLLESLREDRPDQMEAALKRWDSPFVAKRRVSSRVIFHLIVTVVSLFFLTQGTLDLLNHRVILNFVTGSDFDRSPEVIDSTRFNTREKLLLRIGRNNESPTELSKALWESDPTNPAYFAEYTEVSLLHGGKLPADFLAQARLIDPKNAWFPYRAAAVTAKDTVKKRSLSKTAKAARAASEWDVIDQAKLDQALSLLHQCRNLPDCQNYQVRMMRGRIPVLPQRNALEYHRSLAHLNMTTDGSPFSMDLPNAIAAKAWWFGDRSDANGLLALKDDTDAYLRNILRTESGSTFDGVLIEVSAMICFKNLAASAVRLGLTAEAAEMQARLDRLEKLISDRKAGVFEIDGKAANLQVSAVKSRYLMYVANRALHLPVLTDRDVKPGRMIEHEILWQICTYGTWALLGIVTGVAALYRFRSPRLIRSLSARMELLLRPVDWAWLCVAGIPPFIYCLLITHLTPLGGAGSNILAESIQLPYDGVVLLPMAQFTCLFFMMLILPILIARWRLGKRAAFFGFGKARLWSGAIAFISAAAAIPVLGWAVTEASDIALKISWGLFVIPIAWILAVVIRAMTAGANHLLHLTTTARVLVPAYSAAMLILLMATPFFMMSRQRWFEQDTMNHLDAAYPSLTKFEYQLSVAARKELREALGYEPTP